MAGGTGPQFPPGPLLGCVGGGGRLPPVEERLPEDPLVILPSEQNGLYGGTLKRYGTSPRDVGIFGHRLAYDGLVRWGPIGKEVRPNLARRWEMSEGGRTFTFWLRRGVRWSDGHSFTSDDIVFWYEDVLQSPELTPVRINEYYRAGELMQLEKLDAHTLRIRFKEPYGIFLAYLASLSYTHLVAYPAHYLKQFHPRHRDRP